MFASRGRRTIGLICALSMLGAVASYGATPATATIAERAAHLDRVEAVATTSDLAARTARTIAAAYDESFAPLQTRARIASMSDDELALVFRAASTASAYTTDTRYVRAMQLDLDALRARGRATQADYIRLNDEMLRSHMYAEARTIERAHPGSATQRYHSGRGDVVVPVSMTIAPVIRNNAYGSGAQTALVPRNGGREYVRLAVETGEPAHVVVITSPQCHLATAGMHDIQADATVRAALEGHATWLVPPGDVGFAGVATWNRAHPREPMAIGYDFREWSAFARWGTPTFYFLRHGHIVTSFSGWPSGGAMTALRAGLRRIGLL